MSKPGRIESESKMTTFETRYLRYAVSESGWNQSLLDLSSGVDYCRQPGRYPFMSFGNSPEGAPRKISRKGRRLTVSFAKTGAKAIVEVTEKERYLVFELIELKGMDPATFNMATLGVLVTEHIGKTLNVVWNKSFGICLLALDIKNQAITDTIHEPASIRPILTLRSHASFGHKGAKFALIGAPKGMIEDIVFEAAEDYGLPVPKDESGVPMKRSYRAQRSYLFLMHHGKRHEKFALDIAKKGGFGMIMNDNYWTYSSFGSYVFRKDQWPGGMDDLKAWSKRCHDNGIDVGFHSMSSCVAANDPMVPYGVKNGFVSDGGNVLAKDIGAKTSNLPIILPPYGDMAKGYFLIDDEIISVGDNRSLSQLVAVQSQAANKHSHKQKFQLQNVSRGLNGTKAVAHKAGTPMIHFRTRYGFCPDIEGPTGDQVASRLAEIMNSCDLDMIYLDGLEGVHNQQWYNVPRFVMNFFDRLDRQNVIIQSSTYQHYLWHYITRANCGDTAVCYDETSTEHVRAKEVCYMKDRYDNLLQPVHDWHGWNFQNSDTPMGVCLKPTQATTLKDWAVYLESARKFDLPLGILTGIPDLKKNPDTAKMLEMTREYEQERIARLYGEKV